MSKEQCRDRESNKRWYATHKARLATATKQLVGSWNATLKMYEPADKKHYSETVIYKEVRRRDEKN